MFQSKVILQAFRTPVLSENEILNLIDNDILAEIKQKDEHPYFQAYSICHEGISRPKLLDSKIKKPVRWTKKAVQSLKNLALKGVKFFKGHNDDNSTYNRKDFGEVVVNKEMEIEGKLHHIVIGYFPDKEVVKNDDIVSQEGFWNFIESAGQVIADSVENITGIALGNSDYNDPAFSDARRLGMIQCFADGISENLGGIPKNNIKEVIMPLTKKEVVEFIQQNNLHIHELGFTLEDAKKDRIIGKVLEDYENKLKGFEEKEKTFQTEKESYENKIKEYVDKEDQSLAKIRFTELVKNLKDEEKIFLEKKFDINKPQDVSEEGLKKFIELTQNEYKIFEPLFKKADTKIFTPSNEPVTDAEDMTKAANNPLLDEDLNLYQQ